MIRARVAALLFLLHGVSPAAEIVLPAPDLERDQTVTATYRTGSLATGKGTLEIHWSDALGRVVEERKSPIESTDEGEIRFPLDLRRAVAMQNTLTARFTFDGVNRKGAADHRDETAEASFIARPADRDWKDYRIIMWQQYPAEQWNTVKSLGINAGQFVGRNSPPPDFLAGSDLQWYAENIATEFLRVAELGPPEFKSNERFEKPRQLRLTAPAESYIYDVRKGVFVGKRKELELMLDPYEPAIFAFLPATGDSVQLTMSKTAERGRTLDISFAIDSPAAASVFHIEVKDPNGKAAAYYSGNHFGVEGRGGMRIPFAVNESPGTWEVQVRELLTGSTARSSIEVR
jgi:hypothetical protein